MARPKGVFRFNVGLFGIPAKIVDGVVRIKVNVRTDQENQRKLANLPTDSVILLVDCPGGAVAQDEEPDDTALTREIAEETRPPEEMTGGCTITPLREIRDVSQPPPILPKGGKPGDVAVWKPVMLHGEPQPSSEALDHPWVSRADLEAGMAADPKNGLGEGKKTYRPVSGLGLAGRTGKMMVAALDFYETNRDKPELFS